MRFTATGPNIPNELIDAQKRGELLFFCGAGISVPADLPAFEKLTKNVAEKLHALDDENEVLQLLFNKQFDRAFTALKRTYGDEIVDSILLNELKLPKNPFLNNHKNLLKLSINEKNEPFIITTNFDLLFEKVNKKIRSFVPPYLPDLQSKESLSGIVYLHGKWIDPKQGKLNNLILSSQDFGSAYLSHGWATRFLANLLRRRTVVLIGYSGDDTLVRYLLEGLNSENSDTKNKIYAFEKGEQGKVDKKWSQLGAVGISYPDHDDLWDTITEWAKYASDEDKWNMHIFELSQKSPKDLEAFERGQVTNFISTYKGANKFGLFDPVPSSEWIYVFDKYVRLGEPKNVKDEDDHEYQLDPIDLYCIDTDPNRLEIELTPRNLKHNVGEDFIDSISNKSSIILRERVSNLQFEKLWNLSSRITCLIRWLSKVIEQPAGIWWVSNQNNLHPLMIREIEERISKNPNLFSEVKLKFFEKIILSHKLLERQPTINWYELKFLVEKDNNVFTESNLKDLESLLEPTITVNSDFLYTPYLSIEEDKHLNIDFKVEFIGFKNEAIGVNDASLLSVVDILTKSLIKYLNLLKFCPISISSFLNFEYPVITLKDFDNEMQDAYENTGKIIVWLSHLINKQLRLEEKKIHDLSSEWPKNDSFIFNRLKLFVWIHSKNINDLDIGENIENFSDDLFWSTILEADLFKFISEQWDKIPEQDRIIVENKIIRYYPNNEGYDDDLFEKRKIYHTGRLLNQINNSKIGLSESAKKYFLEIKSFEKWNDSFLDEEPFIPGAISGWVETNTSTKIPELELIKDSTKLFDEIKKIEDDKSVVSLQNRPLIRLIQNDIQHVLNQLLKELKFGNLREEYWQQLFENTPESISSEENLIIANAIPLLPSAVIHQCRFSLSKWINEKLVYACKDNQAIFFKVWDFLITTLNGIGPDATKSALGESRLGGKIIKQSRNTYEYALNSPIGNLVSSIFSAYSSWNLDSSDCSKILFPRLEIALNSNGEGASHAAVMIALQLNFILFHDKKWVKLKLIPLLEPDNLLSESTWQGVMQAKVHKKVIPIIKPHLINCLTIKPEWIWDKKFKKNLATYVIIVGYFSYGKKKYYSDLELRKIIRCFDSDMLSHALWMFTQILAKENNWTTFGRHFFNNIWPKEIAFQNTTTSERLLNLILESSDNFDDVLKFTLPFLSKVESSSLFLFRLNKDSHSKLLEQYPDEVLQLLDKVIGLRIEHYDNYLKEILYELSVIKPILKNHTSWRRLIEIAEH